MADWDHAESLDLRHLNKEVYCQYCHNLSLWDHGPAPEGWAANRYYTLLWKVDVDNGATRFEHIDFLLNSEMPMTEYCRYCRVIEACLKHARQLAGPEATFTRYTTFLSPGQNAHICFTYIAGYFQQMIFELYVLDPVIYPLADQGAKTTKQEPITNKESLSFLQDCLTECQQEHGSDCTSAIPKVLPARLLKIDADGAKVTLIHTSSELDDVQWATLSWCWGSQTQPIQTTMQTIRTYEEGIATSSLPILFQNAVEIAFTCGVPYLWIDCLCIVQDDEKDWSSESAKMGAIYKHSLFTIAATRSRNSGDAVVGLGVTNTVDYLSFLLSEPDGTVEMRAQVTNASDRQTCELFNVDGPLRTRGWAYQEYVVAQRLVQFTNRGIGWRCSKGYKYPYSQTYRPVFWLEATPLTWERHIMMFSGRALTHFDDRLPAVSGLAAFVAHRFEQSNGRPATYLAGLWHYRDIGYQLGWRARMSGWIPAPAAEISQHTPSWSWASIEAQIMWAEQADDVLGFVDLLDCSVVPATANAYGPVKEDSYLLLRAKLVDVEINTAIEDETIMFYMYSDMETPMLHDCALLPGTHPDGNRLPTLHRARTQQEAERGRDLLALRSAALVKCMFLWRIDGQYHAMILSLRKGSTDKYERLGVMNWHPLYDDTVPEDVKRRFEEAPLQDIMLV